MRGSATQLHRCTALAASSSTRNGPKTFSTLLNRLATNNLTPHRILTYRLRAYPVPLRPYTSMMACLEPRPARGSRETSAAVEHGSGAEARACLAYKQRRMAASSGRARAASPRGRQRGPSPRQDGQCVGRILQGRAAGSYGPAERLTTALQRRHKPAAAAAKKMPKAGTAAQRGADPRRWMSSAAHPCRPTTARHGGTARWRRCVPSGPWTRAWAATARMSKGPSSGGRPTPTGGANARQ